MIRDTLLILALVVSLILAFAYNAKGAELTGEVEDHPHLGEYILTTGVKGIHIYFTILVDDFAYGIVAWDWVAIDCLDIVIKGDTITVTTEDVDQIHQRALECKEE